MVKIIGEEANPKIAKKKTTKSALDQTAGSPRNPARTTKPLIRPKF